MCEYQRYAEKQTEYKFRYPLEHWSMENIQSEATATTTQLHILTQLTASTSELFPPVYVIKNIQPKTNRSRALTWLTPDNDDTGQIKPGMHTEFDSE